MVSGSMQIRKTAFKSRIIKNTEGKLAETQMKKPASLPSGRRASLLFWRTHFESTAWTLDIDSVHCKHVKSSKNAAFYEQCISCYKLAYFSDEEKKREGGE
jgi:hypothetical protein